MSKLLLTFPFTVTDHAAWDRLRADFTSDGFRVVDCGNKLPGGQLRLEALPGLIAEACETAGGEVETVVVASNARDLLFAWFRLCNAAADLFIYVMDETPCYYIAESSPDFTLALPLANFTGIAGDPVRGRIAVNVNSGNYRRLLGFWLNHARYRYFTALSALPTPWPRQRRQTTTHYRLAHQPPGPQAPDTAASGTAVDGAADASTAVPGTLVTVDLPATDGTPAPLALDDTFLEALLATPWLIPYLVLELLRQWDDPNVKRFVIPLTIQARELAASVPPTVLASPLDGVTTDGTYTFAQRLAAASFLCAVERTNPRRIEQLCALLQDDDRHWALQLTGWMQLPSYLTTGGVVPHDAFFRDMHRGLERASRQVRRRLSAAPSPPPSPCVRRVLIMVDQLLAPTHSPTKFFLDHARALKRVHPELEIHILVTDDMMHPRVALDIPFSFSATRSSALRTVHAALLADSDIRVHYQEASTDKLNDAADIVRTVRTLAPDVVVTDIDFTAYTPILTAEYPALFLAVGITYCATTGFTRYAFGLLDDVKAHQQRLGLLDATRLRSFRCGLDFSAPQRQHARTALGLAPEHFVMITVGNRLDVELTEEFLAGVGAFLAINPAARWLLVCPKPLPQLEPHAARLPAGSVQRLEFEKDLAGLYGICDVFLNPRRAGGGFSVAMAMHAGLPIVRFNDPSDSLLYTGDDATAAATMAAYVQEIQRLMNEPAGRQQQSERMRARIGLFSMDGAAKRLFALLQETHQAFAAVSASAVLAAPTPTS